MNKFKVCVYAISKNEEKFVNRWIDSMSEADKIYVLDTGSDDNTVKLLKDRGVNVQVKKVSPWRFDVARNFSLDLVDEDTDICVCTDLDEVFQSGWRKKLEEKYIKDNRVGYTYNWHLNENGIPDVTFILDKIHPRHGYFWVHPVHEVLKCDGVENRIIINDIILNHYPDNNKSRSSYLELLELSVKEDPLDDRNMHYLGREYMYYGKWVKCIETLKKHLELPSATWNLERAASMRYIARSYLNLKEESEAEYYYKMAINEASETREAYVELGTLYYNQGKWLDSIYYLLKALTIKTKPMVYVNEIFCWDSTIDDILSLNYYNIELFDLSYFHVNKAIEYDKNNKRLLENKDIIKAKMG